MTLTGGTMMLRTVLIAIAVFGGDVLNLEGEEDRKFSLQPGC
jgi:hypothetical protein